MELGEFGANQNGSTGSATSSLAEMYLRLFDLAARAGAEVGDQPPETRLLGKPVGSQQEALMDYLSQHLNYTSSSPLNIELELKLLHFPAKREDLSTAIPLTVILGLLLVTGCIGNLCTAIVIARPKNKYMHTATNYYLFSLAMSDFLFLVLGLPQEIHALWHKYPYAFGELFCIIRAYLSETATYASILTISAFTVERYVAICHPLWAHTMSQLPRAVTSIVIIWCLAAICAIPPAAELGIVSQLSLVSNQILEQTSQCTNKRVIYDYMFAVSAILFFIVPMIIVTVLYILIAIELRRSSKMNSAITKQISSSPSNSLPLGQCCHHHLDKNNNNNNNHHHHHHHRHRHNNNIQAIQQSPSAWSQQLTKQLPVGSTTDPNQQQRPSSAIGLITGQQPVTGSGSSSLSRRMGAPRWAGQLLVSWASGQSFNLKSQNEQREFEQHQQLPTGSSPSEPTGCRSDHCSNQHHHQYSLDIELVGSTTETADEMNKAAGSPPSSHSPLCYHESLISHNQPGCSPSCKQNRRPYRSAHGNHHLTATSGPGSDDYSTECARRSPNQHSHHHNHHHHHHHHHNNNNNNNNNHHHHHHHHHHGHRKSAAGSSKKSVVRMLVAVVVSFFICWLPFHAQRCLASYLIKSGSSSILLHDIFSKLTPISGVTYYLSSTINPLLYQLMSAKFRLAFKETFNCSLLSCLFASPTSGSIGGGTVGGNTSQPSRIRQGVLLQSQGNRVTMTSGRNCSSSNLASQVRRPPGTNSVATNGQLPVAASNSPAEKVSIRSHSSVAQQTGCCRLDCGCYVGCPSCGLIEASCRTAAGSPTGRGLANRLRNSLNASLQSLRRVGSSPTPSWARFRLLGSPRLTKANECSLGCLASGCMERQTGSSASRKMAADEDDHCGDHQQLHSKEDHLADRQPGPDGGEVAHLTATPTGSQVRSPSGHLSRLSSRNEEEEEEEELRRAQLGDHEDGEIDCAATPLLSKHTRNPSQGRPPDEQLDDRLHSLVRTAEQKQLDRQSPDQMGESQACDRLSQKPDVNNKIQEQQHKHDQSAIYLGEQQMASSLDSAAQISYSPASNSSPDQLNQLSISSSGSTSPPQPRDKIESTISAGIQQMSSQKRPPARKPVDRLSSHHNRITRKSPSKLGAQNRPVGSTSSSDSAGSVLVPRRFSKGELMLNQPTLRGARGGSELVNARRKSTSASTKTEQNRLGNRPPDWRLATRLSTNRTRSHSSSLSSSCIATEMNQRLLDKRLSLSTTTTSGALISSTDLDGSCNGLSGQMPHRADLMDCCVADGLPETNVQGRECQVERCVRRENDSIESDARKVESF